MPLNAGNQDFRKDTKRTNIHVYYERVNGYFTDFRSCKRCAKPLLLYLGLRQKAFLQLHTCLVLENVKAVFGACMWEQPWINETTDVKRSILLDNDVTHELCVNLCTLCVWEGGGGKS